MEVKKISKEKKQKIRELIEVYYDYQGNRVRTANRLGKKKNDELQNKEFPNIPIEEIPEIVDVLDNAKDLEANIAKIIEKEIKDVPIYKEFLKKVRGCGVMMSAVLIAYIDVEKATNASKIVQYAGLNAGLVRGKKKDKDGNIIVTEDLIRGDRPTKGYLLPYNAKLKSKILGVLADCFIKSKSQYKMYYDFYKNRKMNSSEYVNGTDKVWKEETKAHIDLASRRFMMRIFLQDLYGHWRPLEGLEVREPYAKEYLNHETSMPKVVLD